MDSTCDCVTFPDVDIDEDNVSDCSVGMTWASFQIYFSEAECVNLQFDDSEVYQNCPSDVSQTDEYILCVIDFTEDSSDDGSMTSQSSSAMSATTSTSNSNDGKSTTDESSSLNLSPTETASQTSDSSQSTTNLNDGAGPSSLANNLAKPTMTRMLSSMMVVLLLQ
ncbi:hypothetical protein PHMEG_00029052 [Phytophthora megakarya]|uniref:Uncharacterized protein n=1 Tax=Phytophthora megakarya TaxID=4795 RepID=A0A225V2Z0_9STRA|nr:hypothetical protein PHMEG_00029052 [Phytophthora megakarya]